MKIFYTKAASLFIGAFEPNDDGQFIFDEPHLVGFSYGFVGLRDKSLGFVMAIIFGFILSFWELDQTGLILALESESKNFKKKFCCPFSGLILSSAPMIR